jgi:macrolide-specific efflux system membrane fusion protein
VPVQLGTVSKTVSADGGIASATTASANFVTSGTVSEIDVTVGQAVQKGQALAKVDPTASQRGLDAAQADLDAANDSLSRASAAGSDTSTARNAVGEQVAVVSASSTSGSDNGGGIGGPGAGTR